MPPPFPTRRSSDLPGARSSASQAPARLSARAEPRSRKAEQSDRTRATLLSVARTLFAEAGYAGTSTEEVVQRAGVTRGALSHHFRDKRELFEAVFVDIQPETRQHIRAATNTHTETWARFTPVSHGSQHHTT